MNLEAGLLVGSIIFVLICLLIFIRYVEAVKRVAELNSKSILRNYYIKTQDIILLWVAVIIFVAACSTIVAIILG
jgi:hypothetical protein